MFNDFNHISYRYCKCAAMIFMDLYFLNVVNWLFLDTKQLIVKLRTKTYTYSGNVTEYSNVLHIYYIQYKHLEKDHTQQTSNNVNCVDNISLLSLI